MKRNSGITLIALAITIIILLILAGITISLTIGQRGILNRAQEAGKNYQEAAKREDEQLSNFLEETDDIINAINGTGETPQQPEISEAVRNLKAGDYIQYNSGENGIITCRVLYPVNSPYGLQIISDKNVKDVTLGGSTWETGKASYNGAIENLNQEALKYVNSEYAYDGRCVGSIPTVVNGMFVDKNNKAKTTFVLPSSYTRPNGWTSNDTGCYDADTNYTTDETALKDAKLWITGEFYWLASYFVVSDTSSTYFLVCNVHMSEGFQRL